MVKVLIVGDVYGCHNSLLQKVVALHSSSHGPFDVVLVTGQIDQQRESIGTGNGTGLGIGGNGSGEVEIMNTDFPIPIYFVGSMPSYMTPQQVPKNVNFLSTANKLVGIANISHNLTVGFVNGLTIGTSSSSIESYRESSDGRKCMDEIVDICRGTAYRGCDFLLSTHWPKDVGQFLGDTDLEELRGLGVVSFVGAGLSLVSTLSNIVRPRYCISAGRRVFYQRPPYKNVPGNVSNHCARFIGLAEVGSSKEKTKKWVHALSITPIVYTSPSELNEIPSNVTENPFIDVNYSSSSSILAGGRMMYDVNPSVVSHLDGPSAKKLRFDSNNNPNPVPPPPAPPPPPPPSFFFGSNVKIGGAVPAVGQLNILAPNKTTKELFVGGLQRETTDKDLMRLLAGSMVVKRPPGKSFAFVEFSSHDSALKVVNIATRQGISLPNGKALNIGWASVKEPTYESNSTSNDSNNIHNDKLLLDPPTPDATTLFVSNLSLSSPNVEKDSRNADVERSLMGILKGSVSVQVLQQGAVGNSNSNSKGGGGPRNLYAFVKFDAFASADLVMKNHAKMAYSLGDKPLAIGWAKDSNNNTNNNSGQKRLLLEAPDGVISTIFIGGLTDPLTTKEDVEALFPHAVSVSKPDGKEFAFVEFKSHDEAVAILRVANNSNSSSCSNSSNSSNSINSSNSNNSSDSGGGDDDNRALTIRGQPVVLGWARGRHSSLSTSANPSSHNQDCWFCLSTAAAKVHLVVSIAESAYLVLPRGGIVDFHVLIVPIDCVPNRVRLSKDAKADFERFEESISRMFAKMECAPLVFERAVRTKGKDHMQLQLIPIPYSKLSTALEVFSKLALDSKLKFSEIQGSTPVDEVVLSMEGGPYQEYFYIQIPCNISGIKHRRFVCVGIENMHMNLGNYITANVLGTPDRANWKNCVLSEEEETKIAASFRTAFEEFDFTSN